MIRARVPTLIRPMRVTTMIANRFIQSGFTLVFSAETTRARVTGHITG